MEDKTKVGIVLGARQTPGETIRNGAIFPFDATEPL